MRVARIRGRPANETVGGRDDGASRPELGPERARGRRTYYHVGVSSSSLFSIAAQRQRWMTLCHLGLVGMEAGSLLKTNPPIN